MKESRYFPHDIGARNDPKLLRLQMEMKGQGLAIWWCLVEMLWENGGYLPYDPRTLSFTLRWAKPNEIERVLNDFGLFLNDGERFWSKSALERIEASQSRVESARRAGKASGARRSGIDPEQPLNGNATDVERPLNDRSTISKEVSKEINKENISIKEKTTPLNGPFNASRLDTHTILEIFFFDLNAPQPAAEVQRFIDHYTARGWRLGDGNPVVDFAAAARLWKPERQVKRFPQLFLRWYRQLYDAAGRPAEMLSGLVEGERKDGRAMLRFASRDMAVRMRDALSGLDPLKGVTVDWKFNV